VWNYRNSWLYKHITAPHPQLRWAVVSGNFERAEALLKGKISRRKVHITLCDVLASGLGQQVVVGALEVMLPHCDPKRNNSEALRMAVLRRLPQAVDLLAPVSDCAAVLTHPEVVASTVEMHHNCSSSLYASYFQGLERVAGEGEVNTLPPAVQLALTRAGNFCAGMQAIVDNNMAALEPLLKALPPNINDCALIKFAMARNRTDMVQRLIPLSDPAVLGGEVLERALRHSNDVCVQALLPYAREHTHAPIPKKTLLNTAIQSGRVSYVHEILSLYGLDANTPDLPRYLPCLKFSKDEPLRTAAKRYTQEIFDVVLRVSDPILRHDTLVDAVVHNAPQCVAHLIPHTQRHSHTTALYNAVRLNHTDCINALLPYGDLSQVLIWVQQHRHTFAQAVSEDALNAVREEMNTQQLRAKLEQVSAANSREPRPRKM